MGGILPSCPGIGSKFCPYLEAANGSQKTENAKFTAKAVALLTISCFLNALLEALLAFSVSSSGLFLSVISCVAQDPQL